MAPENLQIILAKRPVGDITPDVFRSVETGIPSIQDGEFLIKLAWISIDPAMRGWVSPGRSYIAPVEIGEVMRAFAAGVVVESKHAGFSVGDRVSGLFGWQNYAVSNGEGVRRCRDDVPLRAMLGVIGLTGLTAYFGLLDIGEPRAGETVVVSAAAGAVGSIVIQIANLLGCRVIGIAGGAEKCDYVRSLGAKDCIDYKSEDINVRLKETCIDGIDVYFDNVGGPMLDAMFRRINDHARIVICGAISQYNATEGFGPKNYLALLSRRARMEGFVYFDYEGRLDEGEVALATWLNRGLLEYKEDIVDGLESAPDALQRLFDGKNTGKMLVALSEVEGM